MKQQTRKKSLVQISIFLIVLFGNCNPNRNESKFPISVNKISWVIHNYDSVNRHFECNSRGIALSFELFNHSDETICIDYLSMGPPCRWNDIKSLLSLDLLSDSTKGILQPALFLPVDLAIDTLSIPIFLQPKQSIKLKANLATPIIEGTTQEIWKRYYGLLKSEIILVFNPGFIKGHLNKEELHLDVIPDVIVYLNDQRQTE